MGLLTIFEDGIEKVFGKIFPVPKHLQLGDLVRMINREVETHKEKKNGKKFLPHLVNIRLSPELLEQLATGENNLRTHIQNALHSMKQTRGYELEEPFDIQIRIQKEIPPGTFQIIVGETNVARSIIAEPPEQKPPTKKERFGCLTWGVRNAYLIPEGHPLPALPRSGGIQIIHKNVISIGRKFGSGGPFDIELEDTSVSGKKAHAIINLKNDEFRLKDNGSANGTHVNDKKIHRCVLRDGHEIKIGRTVIQFDLQVI